MAELEILRFLLNSDLGQLPGRGVVPPTQSWRRIGSQKPEVTKQRRWEQSHDFCGRDNHAPCLPAAGRHRRLHLPRGSLPSRGFLPSRGSLPSSPRPAQAHLHLALLSLKEWFSVIEISSCSWIQLNKCLLETFHFLMMVHHLNPLGSFHLLLPRTCSLKSRRPSSPTKSTAMPTPETSVKRRWITFVHSGCMMLPGDSPRVSPARRRAGQRRHSPPLTRRGRRGSPRPTSEAVVQDINFVFSLGLPTFSP